MFSHRATVQQLIRPEFMHLHRDSQTVLGILNDTIEILAAAAVDEFHSVGLYASLLRNLVSNKQEEMRTDWNSAERDDRNGNLPRNAGTLTTICNGALAMWNPYAGMSVQDMPQQNLGMIGLNK
jgi:hypothetical protein